MKIETVLSRRLERAEDARVSHRYDESLGIAQDTLAEFGNLELGDTDFYKEFSPVQMALIAKIARMLVSSADSAAKRSILPDKKLGYVETAFYRGVSPIYTNEGFTTKLENETALFSGDEPFLLVEMWRDMAKLLVVASTLYNSQQGADLIMSSERMWNELYRSLEGGHPLQPFISLERQFFLHSLGKTIDVPLIISDIKLLDKKLKNSNPHRLLTLVERAGRIGRYLGNTTLVTEANNIYSRVVLQNRGLLNVKADFVRNGYVFAQQTIAAFVPYPSAKNGSRMDKLHPQLLTMEDAPFIVKRRNGASSK